MPYPTRSYAVTDFFIPIVWHVIQREYRNNMVSDNVDAGYKVKFVDSKAFTENLDSILCMDKVGHYYDVFFFKRCWVHR